MELKELNKKSKEMLSGFIDEIGLDGEYYVSVNCKTPVIYGIPKLIDAHGEYVTPHSERMESILNNKIIDEKVLNVLNERGLIVLNREYKEQEPNPDMFVSMIHEIIHSSRNLMIYDAYRRDNNPAYMLRDGKLDQSTSKFDTTYGDASQDIVKGKVDTSCDTVKKYESMKKKELADVTFWEIDNNEKVEKQTKIDEAMVDIIAALSYRIYAEKGKGNTVDVWELITEMQEKGEGTDIGAMCGIMLKHKDFELFNWMLNPIEYSNGDIHYDFFEEYTKNDQELVNEIYADEEQYLPENFGEALGKYVVDLNKYANQALFDTKKGRQIDDDLTK